MAHNSDVDLEPVKEGSLRDLAYVSLKAAIAKIDNYGTPQEVRLDERKLSAELGMSRTPLREALTALEQEGFVRSEARRGVFLIRKTKDEIVGMIHAWAALESMAARLACEKASDAEIAALRPSFPEFFERAPPFATDEYSEANIRFHQRIVSLGRCKAIEDLTANLFLHVRGIRKIALRTNDRIGISVKEHREIILALEQRDETLAEHLVRNHALGLAMHVRNHLQDF